MKGRLAQGSSLLFAATVGVHAANYAYNLILGRWLGPELYADLSLIVTLMLVGSLATLTLQMVTARAIASEAPDAGAVAGRLSKLGDRFGLAVGAVLVLAAPLWQGFFHSESPWPFVLLGLGMPFYFRQAVYRGILQGELRFGRLAATFHAEAWTRLLLGVGAVAAGTGVSGAAAALSLSFIASLLVAGQPAKSGGPSPALAPMLAPVATMLVGEVLFAHMDVVLVRRWFPAADAGVYAAAALVGRLIFYTPWAILTTMFPAVAKRQAEGLPHRPLLWWSLLLTGALGGGLTLFLAFFGSALVPYVFGDAFAKAVPLLVPYALATNFFTLGMVVVHYRLALEQAAAARFTVAAAITMIVGLVAWHQDLLTVIWVQLAVAAAYLVAGLISISSIRRMSLRPS